MDSVTQLLVVSGVLRWVELGHCLALVLHLGFYSFCLSSLACLEQTSLQSENKLNYEASHGQPPKEGRLSTVDGSQMPSPSATESMQHKSAQCAVQCIYKYANI